jgi:hypothetical protein
VHRARGKISTNPKSATVHLTEGEPMGLVKLLASAVRRIIRFPLVQLALVVTLILLLQNADDDSLPGRMFAALDGLVDSTLRLISAAFTVKSFTRSWLTFSFMIAYVYLGCLLILHIFGVLIAGLVHLVALTNVLGLRNAIARERGIAAYRAWLPFERIRPAHVPQSEWEEKFAWPPGDRPPYPGLARRVLAEIAGYVVLLALTAMLLQIFTPIPAVTWAIELIRRLARPVLSW